MTRSIFNPPPEKYVLKDENFSYANLCKLKLGQRIDSKAYPYWATATKDPRSKSECPEHIVFLRKEDKNDLIFSKGNGYKFHISIHTGTSDNLAHAWNIIFTILDKYSVHQFKILHSDSEAKHAHGKEITIFAFKNRITPEQWERIITELTNELARANIIPSAFPDSDNSIPNTQYVSYRNDGNIQAENPYEKLEIKSSVKQPDRISLPGPKY